LPSITGGPDRRLRAAQAAGRHYFAGNPARRRTRTAHRVEFVRGWCTSR
jgi:hypothetical protein